MVKSMLIYVSSIVSRSTGQSLGHKTLDLLFNCTCIQVSFLLYIIDCGQPSTDASVTATVDSTTFNSRANFTCSEGYENLTGDAFATCQANKSWSEATKPMCTVIGKFP